MRAAEATPELPGFAAGRAESPYWTWLARSEFRLPRCVSCRAWHWPARWRCGDCGSCQHRWEALLPHGIVYSWTRTWYPFVVERRAELPYVVVLAELLGANGARVLGALIGSEDGLAIGRPVTGSIFPSAPESKGLPTVRWRLGAP